MKRELNTLAPRALAIVGSQAGSGVLRIPVTTTGSRFVIPSNFSGKYVTMYTRSTSGTDIYVDFLCGIVGTTVTLDAQSTVDGGTGVVTVNAASGGTCTTSPRPFMMPAATLATHLAWDASGTGTLVIELAE